MPVLLGVKATAVLTDNRSAEPNRVAVAFVDHGAAGALRRLRCGEVRVNWAALGADSPHPAPSMVVLELAPAGAGVAAAAVVFPSDLVDVLHVASRTGRLLVCDADPSADVETILRSGWPFVVPTARLRELLAARESL